MHYVTLALKKNYPNRITKMLHAEDNFHDIQMTKCTKSLDQIDTICPVVDTRLPIYLFVTFKPPDPLD